MNVRIFIILVLLDQISKAGVQYFFTQGESVAVVPPVFFLTYHLNTGAAFGIFKCQAPALLVVSLLFIIALGGYLYYRRHQDFPKTGYYLVLAGAMGNAIDRARLGSVVDFLDFRVWPIFNIADSCVTIGVTILIFQTVFMHKSTGRGYS